MSYLDNVEQAAAALKRGEDANWELARLTYECTFERGGPLNQVGRVSMEKWCADVAAASGRRFGAANGRIYRTVWERFGRQDTNDRPSFADAYYNANGTSREAVYERQAVAHTRTAQPETKRQIFQELARDPDVVQEAATIGSPTSRAVTEIVQRREAVQAEQRERVIDTDPVARTLDRQRAALDIEGYCLRFERDCTRFAREISETLPRTGEATEQHLLWVRGTIERARSVMAQLESYVENGQTDIDAFLQDVLGGATRG